MGCGGSKFDGLEAVTLCRTRSDLLADAIRHRYALAAAHAAYAASLRSVAASLHLLLDGGGGGGAAHAPLLPLPTQRKADPLPVPVPVPAPPAAATIHSHSHSGSHIHFHSDSDSDSDGDSPLHSGTPSPETLAPNFLNIHYARGQPPAPSVSYEHRPQSPTTQNPSLQPYAYPPNYFSYSGMGGFFGPSSSPPPPTAVPPPPAAAPGTSSSRAPPPPPPPKTSSWDFLNPFQSYDTYYPPYSPSRRSNEVREEHEVVKEAYGDQKFVASTSAATLEEYDTRIPSYSKDDGGDSHRQSRSTGAGSSTEDEGDVVEKNVAHEEWRSVAAPAGLRTVSGEIKAQFDRASDSALDLSRMLEVGKLPYRLKNSVYKASSRMMCALIQPSSSKNGDILVFDDDIVMNSRSLSSTLQKLYVWENKLHDEVRAEERLRLLHDKKCNQLKSLDKRGAEAHKIDSTRSSIRDLSTKIRIAIQVVDSISKKINKLTEEELWPLISETIQGLTKMWKVMLECHRTQCQAISEAKTLDSIASGGKLGDTRMDPVMQLELELLRWIGNFSDWISAQKNFVKTLNGWLILRLNYVPEVTPDGIPPYSPGRIGAPLVFVTCNHWSQAMDRIPEKEAVDAMQSFATNLRLLWEQHDVEQQQKMMENGDRDRWLKAREREAQIIHKEVDALNKKLVLVSGQNGLSIDGHSAEASSLQLGLKQIFEAMENFTASSVKAYDELYSRSEEERLARENSEVS